MNRESVLTADIVRLKLATATYFFLVACAGANGFLLASASLPVTLWLQVLRNWIVNELSQQTVEDRWLFQHWEMATLLEQETFAIG